MTNLISICIPTYNQENFISEAIEGALKQKDCNFEIIISNDGSTDETSKICEEYKRKYPQLITLINQSSNKGIIQNTKDCLNTAKGQFIAICEGDDYWIDDFKLSKQVKILLENEDISMVHTNWINLFEKTGKTEFNKWTDMEYISENQHGKKSVEELLDNKYRGIRFSSLLFRKNLLYKIQTQFPDFYSNKFTTLDLGFFYASAFFGKIHALKDYTTIYRLQSNSVSINPNELKRLHFSIGVYYLNCYFLKNLDFECNKLFRYLHQISGPAINTILRFDPKRDFSRLQELWEAYNYKPVITHRILISCSKFKILKKILIALLNRI